MKRAACRDCGKDTEPMRDGRPVFKDWDSYLVPDEIWAEAGMGSEWLSGFLCTPCLTKRLGRKLLPEEYLVRKVGVKKGAMQMVASPEYVERVQAGRGY